MTVRLNVDNNISPRKIIGGMFLVCLASIICFIVISVLSFALIYIVENGVNDESLNVLAHSAQRLIFEPSYFIEIYNKWWNDFLFNVINWQFESLLFLPLIAVMLPLFLLGVLWLKSSYFFSLWYIFNHHFANIYDVERMGILKGIQMVLGRFQDKILGLSRAASVLCFGEAGCGKTSTVAIPSILRSDTSSVLAVDNSGTLAKYTSGYRAKLGKVFYFNWDLQDDNEKNILYPRWNPLAKGNLPPKGIKRDEYLDFVTSYLVANEKKTDRSNYWEMLAYYTVYSMLHFMVSKIEQAEANDYFLNKILENGRLNKEDRDVLLSYYALMPQTYAKKAIVNIKKEKINAEDYYPVGSWAGIPSLWQGKNLCLAMIVDWFIKNYLGSRDNGEFGDWLNWLQSLKTEAKLFNYHSAAIEGLDKLLGLSKQQREIIFAFVLKPFKIFVNQAVRERTGGNDFCLGQLRGIRNSETKEYEPVTVYSTANTKSSKFVNRMFIEMLLKYNLEQHKSKGPLPILTVIDDVGQILKIRDLVECVAKGPQIKMSFLMLCNSLHNVENTYSKENLEDLVVNTNYKIVMAEDTIKLSRQLNKLAVFASKSVQIPIDRKKHNFKYKIFADSNYYHYLAKELRARKNLKILTKGYQILLVEGFYHRPVLTKHVHFLKDEKFRAKAIIPSCYFLSSELIEKRNIQDLHIPSVEDVLGDAGLSIDDEVDLNQYMDRVYDEMKNIAPITKPVDDYNNTSSDWWLQEGAFETEKSLQDGNPFEKK